VLGHVTVASIHDYVEKALGPWDQRPQPLAGFQMLKARAERVSLLPFPDPSEAAFMAAGLVVVERYDQVLAMWEGQPSRGLGGTADVVQYVHQEGRRAVNLWPSGLTRT